MLLEINNLALSFDSLEFLKVSSLKINEPGLNFICGPNGSGKTTFLKSISGLFFNSRNKPGGSIKINGIETSSLSPVKRARFINYSPSNIHSFASFTVDEFLKLAEYTIDPTSPNHRAEVINTFMLEPFLNKSIQALSTGELQVILIARAFVQNSLITCLDETLSNLDYAKLEFVIDKIKLLSNRNNSLVLICSHDLNLASAHSNKIILFSSGNLAAYGSANEILTPTHLRTFFSIGPNSKYDISSGARPQIQWKISE